MSLLKSRVVELATESVAPSVGMLLLRGDDDAARAAGDLDILVEFGTARRAALLLAKACRKEGLCLIELIDNGYVVHLCICDTSQQGSSVKVDFSNGMSWRALGRDCVTREILCLAREKNRESEAVAIATFLQKISSAGWLRPRDKERVFKGIDPERLYSFSNAIGISVSKKTIGSGRAHWLEKWRIRMELCSLQAIEVPYWFVQVAVLTLLTKLFGPFFGRGQIVGISGADRTANASVADRYSDLVDAAEFRPLIRVDSFRSIFPKSISKSKRFDIECAHDGGGVKGGRTSKPAANAKLYYYIVAFYLSAIWFRIRALLGDSLLVENTTADFAVDLARFDSSHCSLSGPLIRRLTPKGKHFWLTRTLADHVDNDCEAKVDDRVNISATTTHLRYLELADAIGGVMLDGDQSPQAVFHSFASQLSDTYITHLETCS